jgi:hypothetical protein
VFWVISVTQKQMYAFCQRTHRQATLKLFDCLSDFGVGPRGEERALQLASIAKAMQQAKFGQVQADV